MNKDQILLEQAYDMIQNGGMANQYKRLDVIVSNYRSQYTLETKQAASSDIKAVLDADRAEALKSIQAENAEYFAQYPEFFEEIYRPDATFGAYSLGEEVMIFVILPSHPLYEVFINPEGPKTSEEDSALDQLLGSIGMIEPD